jgi:hypothetical protein
MEERQEECVQVLLNVYDVTSTPGDPKSTTVRLNRITRELGLGGVFHGAIQIGATAQLGNPEPVEFSFGWCERGTGVYAVHGKQRSGLLSVITANCTHAAAALHVTL